MTVRQSKGRKEKLSLHVLDISNVYTDANGQIVLEFEGKNAREVRLIKETAYGILAWLSGWTEDNQQVNLEFNDVILDASRPKSKRTEKHYDRLREVMALINTATRINIDSGSFACYFTVGDVDSELEPHVVHRLLVDDADIRVDFTEEVANIYVYKPVRQAFLSQYTRTPVEETE